ncbi:hypothetical protein BM43_7505 (plasmid) [Burkholderia gladioli]|nr:hypothetical protein BM43_7505 [Burkholderia gladioli]
MVCMRSVNDVFPSRSKGQKLGVHVDTCTLT